MRLIDADAAVEAIRDEITEAKGIDADPNFIAGLKLGLAYVNTAEAIDAVRVVRCKDCKHFADDYVDTGFGPIPAFSCDVCELYGVGLGLNHYCSHGEREDDETDRR